MSSTKPIVIYCKFWIYNYWVGVNKKKLTWQLDVENLVNLKQCEWEMQLRLKLGPVHRIRQKPTTGSSHEIETKTGTQDETETYDWFKPRDWK